VIDPWAYTKSYRPRFLKQAMFYADSHRYSFLIANSQSGKSFTASPKFARRIVATQKRKRFKAGRYWIVTNTHDIAKPVKSTLVPHFSHEVIDWDKQGKEGTFFKTSRPGGSLYLKNGALIEFKSFEQGESLVSAPLDGLWVDECARCNDPDTWGNLFSRLEDTGGWMIGTSSPTEPGDFYHEVYLRNMDNPAFSWLHWDAYDAADGNAEKLANIEAFKRMVPKHVFEREKLARWTMALGAAYDSFDAERHTLESWAVPDLTGAEWVIGVDIGSNHPTAICVVAVKDGVYWVVECVEFEQPSVTKIVQEVAARARKYKASRVYYDYGGGGSMFANEWVYCMSKGEDRIDPRLLYKALKEHQPTVSRLWTLFSLDKIRIVRDACAPLVRQIPTIVWDDREKREELKRGRDDSADSARYAIATHSIVFRREKLTDFVRAA